MDTEFASKGRPGDLPGYGRPVNYVPKERSLLPNALVNNTGHLQELTTLREFAMMQWMDEVCSKPDWHVKVNNPEITKKWKKETLDAHSPNDFNELMVDYCIAELQDRAKEVVDPANPPPILVFDAGVYRSDTAIPPELKKEVQDAISEFESRIPEKQKDWHPDSDEKVWDLVHPSLFPLIYGKSRILPNGQTATLDNCISLCGSGEVIPEPSEDEVKTASRRHSYWSHPAAGMSYSRRFQWLPCEVDISNPEPKITSYINNLHPVSEKRLYGVVERVLAAAIPLWELTIARIDQESFEPKLRIDCNEARWDRERTYHTDDEDDGDDDNGRERLAPRVLFYPDPEPYTPRPVPQTLNFREKYGEHGLQVIVKFANIQLTPEKPSYSGGTWHVEGQLNEHIVSTALYYYDNENITQSNLSFRQQVDQEERLIEFSYDQDDHRWLEEYFGCENEGPAVQTIGSVQTNEGRLLTFPNILQHRVGSFNLADPTKPGHRKIIALFLVDPNIKVISTANVPCQQREWWWEVVNSQAGESSSATPNKPVGLGRLPAELKHAVYEEVDDFPLSLEVAKEIRLRLMKERSVFVDEQNRAFEANTFSLCEH